MEGNLSYFGSVKSSGVLSGINCSIVGALCSNDVHTLVLCFWFFSRLIRTAVGIHCLTFQITAGAVLLLCHGGVRRHDAWRILPKS